MGLREKMIGRRLLCAVFLMMVSLYSWGRIGKNPYNPATDKAKIAQELNIAEKDILLDSRCAFIKTDAWTPRVALDLLHTCVAIETPEQIVLAEYDSNSEKYVVAYRFAYSELKNVALCVTDLNGPHPAVAGNKLRDLQFTTADAFFSVRMTRGKSGDKPIDDSITADAFDVVKSKGVEVVESPGKVDVLLSQPHAFFLPK